MTLVNTSKELITRDLTAIKAEDEWLIINIGVTHSHT